LDHSPQFAHPRDAREDPRQLAVLRHMGLEEQDRALRIDPARNQARGHLERIRFQGGGLPRHGHSVEIDDAIERIVLVLLSYPIPDRAQVIAEVGHAGGLNAAEYPFP
jgi:hypothetical protein